jgi:hypothetical protein
MHMGIRLHYYPAHITVIVTFVAANSRTNKKRLRNRTSRAQRVYVLANAATLYIPGTKCRVQIITPSRHTLTAIIAHNDVRLYEGVEEVYKTASQGYILNFLAFHSCGLRISAQELISILTACCFIAFDRAAYLIVMLLRQIYSVFQAASTHSSGFTVITNYTWWATAAAILEYA